MIWGYVPEMCVHITSTCYSSSNKVMLYLCVCSSWSLDLLNSRAVSSMTSGVPRVWIRGRRAVGAWSRMFPSSNPLPYYNATLFQAVLCSRGHYTSDDALHRRTSGQHYLSHRCHCVKADFQYPGTKKKIVSKKINAWLGDPGQAYVMISRETSRTLTGPRSLSEDPTEYPLVFHHDTRHFDRERSSYPRIVIPQDLPRQSTANRSKATLYDCGGTHIIVLDGTPLAEFVEQLGASFRRLQSVLNSPKWTW